MTTRHILTRGALTLCLGGLLSTTPTAGAGEQLPDLDTIMRSKLEHTQHLMEAVVLGRLTTVERHAHELTLLSEASTWTALRTPQYLAHAADFREAATGLEAAARDRDSEAVAFAYTELVTTCVQCHRHVRGAQAAD